jgi:eukaryotic-like serine/threonine-protein kinase
MAEGGIPAKIGRYEIESILGRGAMGVIYRAHDPMIERTVALKLVRADLLEGAERQEFIDRFQLEAKAAGRCAHANIVAIYDYALHENNPYIAMEFVAGRSLANLIQSTPRTPVETTVAMVCQVLDALACAHGHGVVHRDIKPANVLLTVDGRVKVTDFGISRLGGGSLTQTGALIGTPNYMSPEQRRGEPVDSRSDLFSTGMMLYELLTGELPYSGRNFHEITHQAMYGVMVPLSQRLPKAPPALVSFMDIALAREPGNRFASAAAMSRALAEALRGIEPRRVSRATDPASVPASTTVDAAPYLADIERKLTRHIGPLASYLVRSASGRIVSLEELCNTLSGSIEKPEARASFLQEIKDLLQASPTQTIVASRLAISQAEVDRVQMQLTRYIGPLAQFLVQRELKEATSADELWQRLAAHIDRLADRQAFLRGRLSP